MAGIYRHTSKVIPSRNNQVFTRFEPVTRQQLASL